MKSLKMLSYVESISFGFDERELKILFRLFIIIHTNQKHSFEFSILMNGVISHLKDISCVQEVRIQKNNLWLPYLQ